MKTKINDQWIDGYITFEREENDNNDFIVLRKAMTVFIFLKMIIIMIKIYKFIFLKI